VVAALGGMLVPALIYASLNWNNAIHLRGWAIPTATDIAFALGILSLLGDKVPLALKAFLTALAIFDDLGAVIIIALYYSTHLSYIFLAAVLICLLILTLFNFYQIKQISIYLAVGAVMWFCFLNSGIHASISGFILALFIPFTVKNSQHSPLGTLEKNLHPWVAFCILPIFGFANAGVSFLGMHWSLLLSPITLGIVLGLFLGKQLGILSAIWLAMKIRLGKFPESVNYRKIYGVAVLCGVGFTMSLFIGALAFDKINSNYVTLVRLGVLSGSLLSGLFGYLWLRFV
jgi:NhaA family Na+:H+ antiporter